MLESARVGLLRGAPLAAAVCFVFDLVLRTVMRISVSPPWVGRGENPGGGRENILDWLGGFPPAGAFLGFVVSDVKFLSTAL